MIEKPENYNPDEQDGEIVAPTETESEHSVEAENLRQSQLLDEIREALSEETTDHLRALCSDLRYEDLADLMELLKPDDRKALIEAIRSEFDADLLSELEGRALEDVISVLEPQEIADAVQNMDTDDAVWVLEEMSEEEQQDVLDRISDDDRLMLEQSLSYPEDSAGRLMQRDLISVPTFWTVGQTLDYLRETPDLPEDFWEIFVVDPTHRPIGTLPLSWVMRAKRPTKIEELMKTEQTLIPIEMDQEEIAYRFQKYNLVSAAVVDDDGRLAGMVTVDDIVDVIEEEADEDILALAGVSEGDVNISVMKIFKSRFGWLFLNLLTAILASLVIGLFDATIEKLVALAILMPIVASMGGNAGTQTMTVAVRALATKELSAANAWRVFGKEVSVSVMNGGLFAVIMGIVAHLWFGDAMLGLVIGLAMIVNLFFAGMAGIIVPMTLERFNIDPAVSSSVFVTTITDVVGFFAFLGLAAMMLL